MQSNRHMKKKIFLGVSLAVVMLALVVLGQRVRESISHHSQLYSRPRKAWKELALVPIARLATDRTWLTNEVAKVKASPSQEALPWLPENLILMQNGEWLVYTNICNKEDARLHDLFIAKGSNAKWYYSDFHFCIRMISLEVLGVDQPANLQQFIDDYSVRNFDGRSDECLQESWDRKLHFHVSNTR